MPKFIITLKETDIYVVEDIEAENEAEAFEKALDEIATEEGKHQHFHDSDGTYESEEV